MEWFERWFGEEYLLVYEHRDTREASAESEAVIRVLGLRQGDLVLDLCCGSGRHDQVLASHGCRIYGIDFSLPLLKQAIAATGEAPYPRYIRGDVRRLPFADNVFDAVLNMFTSFGYFGDEENEELIRSIARILKPDGRFLIDYLNPPRVLATLAPVTERKRGGIIIREERAVDHDTKRIEKVIRISDGASTRTYHESVRLYTEPEMRGMVGRAGLTITGIAGSVDLAEYNDTAERMVVYGRNPG